MATVGAIRIDDRIGYFPVINGKAWEVVYIGREGLLKAIAESLWHKYRGWLEWEFRTQAAQLRAALLETAETERGHVLAQRFAGEAERIGRIIDDHRLVTALYDGTITHGVVAIVPLEMPLRFTFTNREGRLDVTEYDQAMTMGEFLDVIGYDSEPQDDEVPGTVPQP